MVPYVLLTPSLLRCSAAIHQPDPVCILFPAHASPTRGDFATTQAAEVDVPSLPAHLSHETRQQTMREVVLHERLLAYFEDLAEWFSSMSLPAILPKTSFT